MVKKLQYFIVLTALVFTGLAFKFISRSGVNSIKIIVIDAGHGGKDPGCLGFTHKEKEVSLAVALKLGKYLEENFKDVKVVYTRTTDVFVELEDRAQIANKAKADLFISIHCNAAGKPVMVKDAKTGRKRPKTYRNKKGKLIVVEKPNPGPYGTETYVMGLKNEEGKMKVATRENSAIFYEDDYEKKYGGFDPESEESYIIMSNYTSAYVIQSANLALKMQDEYQRKAGRLDRGVHRQSIWVLWRTSMPSILTELGYLTNPLEETFLGSDKGQEYLAKAMFRGIRKYKDEVEGNKKEYNDEFENQTPLENENIKAKGQSNSKKTEDEDDDEEDVVANDEPEDTKATEPEVPKTEKKPKPIAVEQGSVALKQISEEVSDYEQNSEKEDSVVSAKVIADKFKKETKLADQPKSETANTLKKEQELKLAELKKKEDLIKNEVVFKVQFATSDIALNLKQEKFAAITDADFYKVNKTLKYTSGKFSNVKDAFDHQTDLRKKGFTDCFVIAVKGGERIDLNEAKKLVGQ
ncbi:N-acetylmuramoyl-L-alanine amidase family protein [Aurantibacillus circumpalustris]|uniref:N-acetylmuramoyl-L-alanine amidase family protein n=1 Tax=Aurantibacillus circumpalustris TaxID=3036359 RepID=UPI00295C2267|nr:N-acetylmuramoyl-L-alanine amidase [Aurantibacillus circumpalustris]